MRLKGKDIEIWLNTPLEIFDWFSPIEMCNKGRAKEIESMLIGLVY